MGWQVRARNGATNAQRRLVQHYFSIHDPQHNPKTKSARRTDLSYSQIANSQQRTKDGCLAAIRKTFIWRVDVTEKSA